MAESFWIAPRRTAIRRYLFTFHLYIGLAAGIVWTLVGLTGSAIVFVPELHRMEIPGWTRVGANGKPLPLQTLVDRFYQERPGDKIYRITYDFKPGWAVSFRSSAPNKDRIYTFMDPYRGVSVGSTNYRYNRLWKLNLFHSGLWDMGGALGRKVNAWLAVVLCVTVLSGSLLWWRGRDHWKSGFRYHAQAGWKSQMWDLHTLGGLIFSLPLILIAVSGTYLCYYDAWVSAVAAITGGPAAIPPPKGKAPTGIAPTLDEVVENAGRSIPDGTIAMIQFPERASDVFSVRMTRPSDMEERFGLNFVYVDPATAKVLRVDQLDQQPVGVRIIRQLNSLHTGAFGGWITRVLWLVIGLIPGMLFITSLLLWRNARRASA